MRQEIGRPGDGIAQVPGVAESLASISRLLHCEGTAEDAATADWSLEASLTDALTRVGLGAPDPWQPLATLSGGQRTRLWVHCQPIISILITELTAVVLAILRSIPYPSHSLFPRPFEGIISARRRVAGRRLLKDY